MVSAERDRGGEERLSSSPRKKSYLEILRKIIELVEKRLRYGLSAEEEKELAELKTREEGVISYLLRGMPNFRTLVEEREKRIAGFLRELEELPFEKEKGRKTGRTARKAIEDIRREIVELQREGEKQIVGVLPESQREKARLILETKIKRIEEAVAEILKERKEKGEIEEEEERRLRERILERGQSVRGKDAEKLRKQLTERMRRFLTRQLTLLRRQDLSEEDISRMVRPIEQLLREIESASSEELENLAKVLQGEEDSFARGSTIITFDVGEICRNREYRDKVFEEILGRFGSDRLSFFEKADMYTHAAWMAFQAAILEGGREIEETTGKTAEEVLTRYQAIFGLVEAGHNLTAALRTSFHSLDELLPQVMGKFEASFVDVATRIPGVMSRVRLLESFFMRVGLEHGYFPTEAIEYDAETGEIKIGRAIRANIREIIGQRQAEAAEEGFFDEGVLMKIAESLYAITLRAYEIQAGLPLTREFPEVGSPEAEDLARVLDPNSLPLRYWWASDPAAREFLTSKGRTMSLSATKEGRIFKGKLMASWFAHTGKLAEFDTYQEWEEAVRRAEETGELHFNIFNIGGPLSATDWRVTKALPDGFVIDLAPFLGVEMTAKILRDWGDFRKQYSTKEEAKKAAKRTALAIARTRNPLALFFLADRVDQIAILRRCGVEIGDDDFYEKTRTFFGQKGEDGYDVYDRLSQALEILVSCQSKRIREILAIKDRAKREEEAQKFLSEEITKGLDFSFVEDENQRRILEQFVLAVQEHFGEIELADHGWVRVDARGNEAFERLVNKRHSFSLTIADAMLEVFKFEKTGPKSWQRRFRDLGACVRAVKAYWRLIINLGDATSSDEKTIEYLKAIKDPLYDYMAGDSTPFILNLFYRIVELRREDFLQRLLPYPLNVLRDRWGTASLRSKLLGKVGQPPLDRDDIMFLAEKAIASDLFRGMIAKEVRRECRKRFRTGNIDILAEKIIRYTPVGIFFILLALLYLANKQIKKAVEEQSGKK